jgi:hypothetical protein
VRKIAAQFGVVPLAGWAGPPPGPLVTTPNLNQEGPSWIRGLILW